MDPDEEFEGWQVRYTYDDTVLQVDPDSCEVQDVFGASLSNCNPDISGQIYAMSLSTRGTSGPSPPGELMTVAFTVHDIGNSDFDVATGTQNDTLFIYLGTDDYWIPGTITVDQVSSAAPPVANADGPYHGNRTQTVTLDGSASYAPDGDIVDHMWRVDGKQVYSGDGGVYDLTLAGYELGVHPVVLVVTDNQGGRNQDQTTLTVTNASPVAHDVTAITDQEVAIAIDVTANDHDPDGDIDPATVTILTHPSHGSVAVDLATGEVTYAPGAHFYGSDVFSYTVEDDDGATSNQATVTVTVNPAPVISHLEPVSAPVGSPGFTLTVYGSHFVGESTVHWDGEARVTTYVDETELRAAIPAADLTAVGAVRVAVVNPVKQGGPSNAVCFAITPADGDPRTHYLYLPLVIGGGPEEGAR